MQLELRYELGHDVYLAQGELTDPEWWSTLRAQFVRQQILPGFVLLLAIVAAYKAQFVAMFFFFIAMLIVILFKLATHGRTFRKTLEASVRTMPRKNVHLIVKEDGLLETVEGITSFAPWPAVVFYSVFKDVLFIKLKAGLWSMIPRRGLDASSASVDQVIEFLKDKGIPECGNVSADK